MSFNNTVDVARYYCSVMTTTSAVCHHILLLLSEILYSVTKQYSYSQFPHFALRANVCECKSTSYFRQSITQ